jgi:hypothetical protein
MDNGCFDACANCLVADINIGAQPLESRGNRLSSGVSIEDPRIDIGTSADHRGVAEIANEMSPDPPPSPCAESIPWPESKTISWLRSDTWSLRRVATPKVSCSSADCSPPILKNPGRAGARRPTGPWSGGRHLRPDLRRPPIEAAAATIRNEGFVQTSRGLAALATHRGSDTGDDLRCRCPPPGCARSAMD